MYRRSRALKDVPGPDYPLLTGKLELLSMRDMHRFCTESAEKYGPIFKWRLFTFHVGGPALLQPGRRPVACVLPTTYLHRAGHPAMCVLLPRMAAYSRDGRRIYVGLHSSKVNVGNSRFLIGAKSTAVRLAS